MLYDFFPTEMNYVPIFTTEGFFEKLKVGDKVKVTYSNGDFYNDAAIGEVGYITYIDGENIYIKTNNSGFTTSIYCVTRID